MSLNDKVAMMHTHRVLPASLALALLAAPLLAQPSAATPKHDSTAVDVERRAQLARRGGGLRVGPWAVRGLEVPANTKESTLPAFEGYVRKGLDAHLVLENSIGLWRHSATLTETMTGPLGSTTTTSTVETYIIPQLTSIVFYPVTGPEARLEPYARAGIGFAIGVEDREGDSGGLLGGSSSGTALVPGFDLTTGLGVEWRLSRALGLSGGARYQWVRFFQELAGQRTFQGLGIDLGVTYRFQYR